MGEAYNAHTIIQKVYDSTEEAIKTTGGGGDVNVKLVDVDFTTTQTDDLNVSVTNSTISVEGTYDIISYGQKAVDNSATKIADEEVFRRMGIQLVNVGDNTVYIGDSNVTTATGAPLFARSAMILPTRDAIYGITEETEGSTVSYMEI